MALWLTIVIIGILTYALRLSFILLMDRIDMPALFQRTLRFVPAAVLSAIILPALLLHNGNLNLTLSNTRLIAGILAILIAWRTKNVFLTIGVGMGSLWLLQIFIH